MKYLLHEYLLVALDVEAGSSHVLNALTAEVEDRSSLLYRSVVLDSLDTSLKALVGVNLNRVDSGVVTIEIEGFASYNNLGRVAVALIRTVVATTLVDYVEVWLSSIIRDVVLLEVHGHIARSTSSILTYVWNRCMALFPGNSEFKP